MKKEIKYLILIYVILVLIKILLISLIPAPIEFSDYYVYSKMARGFLYHGNFKIHEMLRNIYPPLYPITISPSFIFKDMNLVYFFIKLINALVSTLIIIPAYLLSREFLNEKEALKPSLLILLIPSVFAFSAYIMSENLYYTLFLFFIYFLYKSFQENSYKWDILTGIFMGLAILTRYIAFSLPLIVILSSTLYLLIKKEGIIKQIKKKILAGIITLLVISPWIIRNIIEFGFSIRGIIGGSPYLQLTTTLSGKYTFISFLTLLIFYLAFLIISSGILFFLTTISVIKRLSKDKNLFIISIITLSSLITTLLIAAAHNSGIIKYNIIFSWFTGKLVGRYIDQIIPLIIITGFIGLKYFKEDKKLIKHVAIFSSLVLLFSSQIIFMSLFPVNNISLTHLGILNFIIGYIFANIKTFTPQFNMISLLIFSALFFILPFIIIYVVKKIKMHKLMIFLMIFLLLISITNLAVTYFESDRSWYNSEQTKLGLFFNKYDKNKISLVLFDQDYIGNLSKTEQDALISNTKFLTIAGFWMNDDIIVRDVDDVDDVDYVITKKELKYKKIYQTDNGIFLYEVKS